MPELPEVETVRRGLEPWVKGKKIKLIDVVHKGGNRSSTFAPVNSANGARIKALRRRGKFLWFDLDRDFALVAHLGMSGQFLVQPKKSADEKHLRVRLDCGDKGKEIRFIDQRTFGWVAIDELVEESGKLVPRSFARIALDIFDPDFKNSEVVERIRKKKSVMSGVGNIYADESLWRAKIHPERLAHTLSEAEINELLRAVKSVMGKALKQGGTSFDDLYINVNGESGYFAVELEAYGQEDEPCSRCGTQIKRIVFGNRSSHFCPKCQKNLKKSGIRQR
jgi:formamidopyrimidine-DNA glycosylase